ncbi:kinase-like domain-containing protein [Rhizophagus clarus]|uniref:Kinase-like domain-containing protein n=1 Tax=Rhizophagus clarus TaxID=94130 RepID=A0A8H3M891_9GLOM|nr:kinase-like domain-containing protein [Rhizophagus clarus]
MNSLTEKSNKKCIKCKFKYTQLLAHDDIGEVLEWIPYDRFDNIEYIEKIGICRAHWIDGCIDKWDDENQSWKRYNRNILVTLKGLLHDPKDITLEFMNEIKIDYEFYGITQDPQTKSYMMVLNDKCKECNYLCNAIHFQRNFENWTSGDDNIDKLIQNTQLSTHDNAKEALEWIPYYRFNNIKYVEKIDVYRANWIDGCIVKWDNENQNWKRYNKNVVVILKNINSSNYSSFAFISEITKFNVPKDITLELMNEIKKDYKFYGITQDPQTKNYMMVLDVKCKKCNYKCSTIRFQQNFGSWTSGNDEIDGFIQDTQLSAHYILKNLNNPKNVTLELMNMPNYATYGITQDPQTKNYMMVLELNNECKKCNFKCSVMHFYQNFENWTSGNDDIDKFIQDTQLSAHHSAKAALEWIPYDRFCDIKYTVERKLYNANWIDGYIIYWDYKNHNWARKGQNILVSLKSLNNPKNITFEFMNEIKIDLKRLDLPKYVTIKFRDKIEMDYEFYGITQDPQTKNYMIVLNNKCGFGKVYKANWIDGHIDKWNNINQNWKRRDENMFVALKSLDHSKNITLKFMNEMIFHHNIDSSDNIVKFYGITQDPQTYNYIMVMEYANDGSLREYLKTNFNKLNWESKITYLYDIITGLKFIHDNYLIHRDLHIGNILKLKYKVAITDMGLCKPTISNARKNNIYGVLPYIAPEILRGQTYTSAADIYSFGMIMYEIISGLPPFHDVGHDNYLAIKICRGLRPRFNIKVPQLIVSLIKRCLDASPSNRPKVKEISKILREWIYELNESYKFGQTELKRQIKEADIINNNSSNNRIPSTSLGLSYETHSEAVYTSRLLDFDDLPEPKNLDDYSEHNENIISVESSVSLSLQIDVNNNNNNLPEPKKVDNCYKQNDNLISVKSSASLSISQLNINNDTFSEPKNSDKQNNDVTGMEYSGIISTFVECELTKTDKFLFY